MTDSASTRARPLRSLSDLLRDVVQLAYVTDDLDAAVAWLQESLGTTRPHSIVGSSLAGTAVVDGVLAEEWTIDVALVNAGDTNLEVIRPVAGAVDLYRAAIRPGAPATFHHIGVRVDDIDEATTLVRSTGRDWVLHGEMPGIRFGYLDLVAEVGHLVEVMEIGPGFQSFLDVLRAESEG